jgi:enoyl-CoA hydratase/carnithine racemase
LRDRFDYPARIETRNDDMSDHIQVQFDAGVLQVEFCRREKKNALTRAMYAALSVALTRAEHEESIRVVLLRGQKDLFTAGNDIEDFLGHPAGDSSEALRFLQLVAAFPKPLVAAVGGSAIGIGTTLLLHCDLIYAAETALFELPFVRLGLCPEGASSVLLPRLVGYQRAAELLFFGAPFDAMRAQQMGLVNEVFAEDELLTTALARARQLACLPATSLAVTKALLKRASTGTVTDTLLREARNFADLLAAPAAQAAFAAFLAKRRAGPGGALGR